MELWVRSQDKKCLIKAKIIKFENGCLRGATDDDGWYYDLGKYKKERALKVLDEIQENIERQGQTIIITDENGILNGSKFFGNVYEMPKE